MRKLLLKLFIKNYQDTSNLNVRAKYGILSGIIGIIVNIILCTIKIVAGIISGSVSILADGINNLSDAGTSVVTMIGFKLSSAPADEKHPFGHERIEYISAMIVSIIIVIIGFSLFKTSIEKIISPTDVEINYYLFIILGIGILFKLWQGIFNRGLGKMINSTALMATSQDSINDVISTSAVVLGMVISLLFDVNVDGYVGLLVSLFIFKSGYDLVKDAAAPLIGVNPTEEEIEEVTNKVLSYEGVLGIHDLVFHSYGPSKKFITVHAEVDANSDFMTCHDVMDNIEKDFKNEFNIDLVIHMDPIDINNPETIKLRTMVHEIITGYDEKFTMHDFRVVHGHTHTNLLFDLVIPYKYPVTIQQLKKEIIELIKIQNAKLEVIITVDQMYDRNN